MAVKVVVTGINTEKREASVIKAVAIEVDWKKRTEPKVIRGRATKVIETRAPNYDDRTELISDIQLINCFYVYQL